MLTSLDKVADSAQEFMAADTPIADDKKKAPDTHGDTSATAAKPAATAKEVASGTASPEQVKKAVDSNVVADPSKLSTDTFSCKVGSTVDWTKPASTNLNFLYLDNSCYGSSADSSSGKSSATDFSKGLAGSTSPTDFSKISDLQSFPPISNSTGLPTLAEQFDSKKSPLDFKVDSMRSINAINTFNNKDYANAFWTNDFSNNFESSASSLVTDAFGKSGAAKAGDTTKPSSMDAAVSATLAAHKSGETWNDKGVSNYKTDSGDLVQRDAKGFHYQSTDGLKVDAKNPNEFTISKGGDTLEISKKGKEYFKKSADGQEQRILKDDPILAEVVKFDNTFVQQRRVALEKLSPQQMERERRQGSHIVQGTDGVQTYKVDPQGDMIAKSSKEPGAKVRTSDNHNFYIRDGKVFQLNDAGDQMGSEVEPGKLPPSIHSNGDGSYTIGSVTVDKNNQYHDAEHNVRMKDQAARVDFDSSKGPVVATVENGQEKIQAPDHTYNFDSKDGPKGHLTVQNSDGSSALDYNYNNNVLASDGVVCGPNGMDLGDGNVLNWDGSFSDHGQEIYSASSDPEDYGTSYAESSAATVQDVTEDASSEVSEVAGDINNFTSDFGDVAELSEDLSSLTTAQGLHLDDDSRSRLNSQISRVSAALDATTRQAEASALSVNLTGIQNSELTKEIAETGGSTQAAQAVMRRWGILPPLELYDSSQVA